MVTKLVLLILRAEHYTCQHILRIRLSIPKKKLVLLWSPKSVAPTQSHSSQDWKLLMESQLTFWRGESTGRMGVPIELSHAILKDKTSEQSSNSQAVPSHGGLFFSMARYIGGVKVSRRCKAAAKMGVLFRICTGVTTFR